MTWLTMTPTRLAIPRKAMKPKAERMTSESDQRADDAVGRGGEDEERLDGVLNWNASARKIMAMEMAMTMARLTKPCLLLGLLAADDDAGSRAAGSSANCCELRRGGVEDFGRKNAGRGKLDTEMVRKCSRWRMRTSLQDVFDARDLHAAGLCSGDERGIDVEAV